MPHLDHPGAAHELEIFLQRIELKIRLPDLCLDGELGLRDALRGGRRLQAGCGKNNDLAEIDRRAVGLSDDVVAEAEAGSDLSGDGSFGRRMTNVRRRSLV